MADETVFDLLHSEIVNYTLESHESKNKDAKEEDLSVIEYIGFSAGYRIIERLTKEMPRFKDELDTMKFICTDFWCAVYKKQIDNLRTNHQGVYVLQDNDFRFLNKLSSGKQYLEAAPRYAAFTCGIIRGCLSNLNINCLVTAEVQNMPSYVDQCSSVRKRTVDCLTTFWENFICHLRVLDCILLQSKTKASGYQAPENGK